jgi:hypothetical protein
VWQARGRSAGAPGLWVDGLVGRKYRRRAGHPARFRARTPSPRARATSGCLRVTSLPACPAEALHLRFAREDPTAVQAEELTGALGPPIAQGRRRRALEVHHLSMIRSAVGAQYRVGAEWARGTHRRHGVSLSRGYGARWYRPRGGGGTRSHADSVIRCSSISGGGLPSLPLGFGPLALALHGRLLVVSPPLHFLEHSALQHLPLEGLQRRLDLIVEDLDPQWRTFLPPHGAWWPPLTLRPGPAMGGPRRSRHPGSSESSPFRVLTSLAVAPIVGPDPVPRDDRNGGTKERDPFRPVTREPSRLRCRVPATSPRSLDGSGQDAWRDSRGWSSQQGPLPCMTTVVH